MSTTPTSHRGDLTAQLITKAMKDEAFRTALLTDPKSAISRELGITIPAGIGVQVHEESTDLLHLVLPPKALPADGRLSDADLDRVAGGNADDWFKRLVCTGPMGGDTNC
jgi:hypothetical protein